MHTYSAAVGSSPDNSLAGENKERPEDKGLAPSESLTTGVYTDLIMQSTEMLDGDVLERNTSDTEQQRRRERERAHIIRKCSEMDKGASHSIRAALPQELLETIDHDLFVLDKPTPDTYTPAREYVTKMMERVFFQCVVPSPDYARYINSLDLPDKNYKAIKKKYAQKYGTG